MTLTNENEDGILTIRKGRHKMNIKFITLALLFFSFIFCNCKNQNATEQQTPESTTAKIEYKYSAVLTTGDCFPTGTQFSYVDEYAGTNSFTWTNFHSTSSIIKTIPRGQSASCTIEFTGGVGVYQTYDISMTVQIYKNDQLWRQQTSTAHCYNYGAINGFFVHPSLTISDVIP